MFRGSSIAALALLSTSYATASVVVTVDKLSSGDPGFAGIPAHVVIADVFANVSTGDSWTGAGLEGAAMNGAFLRYYQVSPGVVSLISVPLANRFSTQISKPRTDRYTLNPPPPGIATSGRYCAPGPAPVVNPTAINVAWFASPPESSTSPTVDGYFARIALDITNTPYPTSWVQAHPIGSQPAGAVPLFLSTCPSGGIGTVAATFDVPAPVGLDWGLYAVWIPFFWVELNFDFGGAGDSLATAQRAFGTGPLTGIMGVLDEDDVDIYMIAITDSRNFAASTVGSTGWDTQLFLFDQEGRAIAMNDDAPGAGTAESALSNRFVTTNGRYYLAISRSDRDPVNSDRQAIWEDRPADEERAPDGPGAPSPFLDHWSDATPFAGRYEIALNGASFITPCRGDVNGDGRTDLLDLTTLLANFGTAAGAIYTDGDLDEDGDVDLADLTELLAGFGQMCSP